MSQKSSVAKDVFAYLLTFVVLYIGVVNFITLIWQIIEIRFPDPTSFFYSGAYDAMRGAISALIIVWPVFLLMSRHLARDLSKFPQKANLWVRRWLTYLTVFVASITIIIDLIIALNTFLSGELTLRFAFKTLTVLVVAILVLGYEHFELYRSSNQGIKQLQWMAWGSVVLVALSIVAGFIFVGSPMTARDYRLDDRRVTDLQSLQYQIVDRWRNTDVLPESLDILEDPINGYEVPIDPSNQTPYMYQVTGELTFSLCATFERATPPWGETASHIYYEAPGQMAKTWTHEAGLVCFERTIDPALHGDTTLGVPKPARVQ